MLVCGSLVYATLLFLCPLAKGRQLPPRVSTATFDENSTRRMPPLAVLQISAAEEGAGASPSLEMRVFPEDPNWSSEVCRWSLHSRSYRVYRGDVGAKFCSVEG